MDVHVINAIGSVIFFRFVPKLEYICARDFDYSKICAAIFAPDGFGLLEGT
jgi:hypothetical protein